MLTAAYALLLVACSCSLGLFGFFAGRCARKLAAIRPTRLTSRLLTARALGTVWDEAKVLAGLGRWAAALGPIYEAERNVRLAQR